MPDTSTILVIEDDYRFLKTTYLTLTEAGYQVELAQTGPNGIAIAQEAPPDLVLCDLAMVDMTGFDVLQILRANESTTLTPVILISENGSESVRRSAMEMGADDFLVKPLSNRKLLSAIRSQLERHKKVRASHEAEKERINRAKKQLSMIVAHELRTPLMTVTMSRDLMWMQLEEDNLQADDMRDLMLMMSKGVQRLKHLVEQMVLLTQVETGILQADSIRQHFYEIDLHAFLTDAIMLARQFSYEPVETVVNLQSPNLNRPISIRCNIESLKHAVAELIDNAINFSPEGAPVHITYEQNEDGVWISIVDQGPGIPPEAMSTALETFAQLGRDRTEQQGIGMGLALAHRIIESHSGSLHMQPGPNGGTQVIIGLPLA